ncbi:MAG: CotH kinase family protein [Verrucomicrobiota bacterium]
MSRSIGRYSSRTRLVEVFTCFNANVVSYTAPTVGHYNGIYVLQEKIKADAERVNVPRLTPSDTNTPAITGGYVLKIDRADADERTVTAGSQTMVFVEPQMKDYSTYPGRALQQNYLAGYFNSFYSALTGVNWTNPVTGYAAWIDVDAWVDHHILNVLSLSSDALRFSAYFFKDRDKKIEMGPLWDFDRGLGTSAGSDWRAWNPRSWMGANPLGDATGTDYGTDFFNPAGVFADPWYSRLVKDPDFWQKWIDRYQTLRPNEFSTNSLFVIIDSLTNKLGAAQAREISKWPDSAPRPGTVLPPTGWPDRSYSHTFPGSYAGEIAFLKRWLTDRLNFIDTNFLARPTLNHPGGLVSTSQTVTITPAAKTGSSLLYTLNGTRSSLAWWCDFSHGVFQ